MAKVFERTILIPENEVKELQEILDIREGYAEDYGKDEVISTHSTVFRTPYGKFGVDIKVCNGDTPYVDPVLFQIVSNENGTEGWYEIYPLDVDDTLIGDYIFTLDKDDCGEDIELHVSVKEGRSNYGVKAISKKDGSQEIFDGFTIRVEALEFAVELEKVDKLTGSKGEFEYRIAMHDEYSKELEDVLNSLSKEIESIEAKGNLTQEDKEKIEDLQVEYSIVASTLAGFN